IALGMSAVGLLLDLLAIGLTRDIRGVAWATFVTFVLNSVVLMALAKSGLGPGFGRRLGMLARAFFPLALSMPLAYAFERLVPGFGHSWTMRGLRFLASAVMWLAAYGALTAPLLRGVGLRALAAEIRWPGTAPAPEALHAE